MDYKAAAAKLNEFNNFLYPFRKKAHQLSIIEEIREMYKTNPFITRISFFHEFDIAIKEAANKLNVQMHVIRGTCEK